jgi:hypothetical protein
VGKRAKIINAEGESLAAALGEARDIMMAHPLALPPAARYGIRTGTLRSTA